MTNSAQITTTTGSMYQIRLPLTSLLNQSQLMASLGTNPQVTHIYLYVTIIYI